MRVVIGADSAVNAERLAGHVGIKAGDAPAADDVIHYGGHGTQEWPPFSDGEVVNEIGRDYMRAVEIGECALIAPVANVGCGSGAGGCEAAAGRSSHRIHG